MRHGFNGADAVLLLLGVLLLWTFAYSRRRGDESREAAAPAPREPSDRRLVVEWAYCAVVAELETLSWDWAHTGSADGIRLEATDG